MVCAVSPPRQRGDSVSERPVRLPDLGHQLQVSGQPQVQRVFSQSGHGGQQPRRHSVIAQNKLPGPDNPPPPNERRAGVHVLHVKPGTMPARFLSREFKSSHFKFLFTLLMIIIINPNNVFILVPLPLSTLPELHFCALKILVLFFVANHFFFLDHHEYFHCFHDEVVSIQSLKNLYPAVETKC